MATFNIIKLRFLTPLHIGTGKENYDFSSSDLHSDALTAALAAIRVQSGGVGGVEDFLNSFRLSSAFPFVGSRYYLPKIGGKIKLKETDDSNSRKALKGIKYIEHSLWGKLVNGEELNPDSVKMQGMLLECVGENVSSPYVNQVMQRVAVPRCSNSDATPFFFDWRYFDESAGLFCLTDAKGEQFEELVRLFARLGEAGIGTDRNVGGGKFEVETDKMELPEVKNPNATIVLSLYLPEESEVVNLSLKEAAYNLLLRGGYMAGSSDETLRHLWKKNVYMFDVGSVFPNVTPLAGKVVDLSPDWEDTQRMHPVYRSGKPFTLPIKI